jgi:hypothetical protein
MTGRPRWHRETLTVLCGLDYVLASHLKRLPGDPPAYFAGWRGVLHMSVYGL